MPDIPAPLTFCYDLSRNLKYLGLRCPIPVGLIPQMLLTSTEPGPAWFAAVILFALTNCLNLAILCLLTISLRSELVGNYFYLENDMICGRTSPHYETSRVHVHSITFFSFYRDTADFRMYLFEFAATAEHQAHISLSTRNQQNGVFEGGDRGSRLSAELLPENALRQHIQGGVL